MRRERDVSQTILTTTSMTLPDDYNSMEDAVQRRGRGSNPSDGQKLGMPLGMPYSVFSSVSPKTSLNGARASRHTGGLGKTAGMLSTA